MPDDDGGPSGPRPSRLRRAGQIAAGTADHAVRGFFDDGAPQAAAAISYYALFSLFPLTILMVSVYGLVLDGADARERIINALLDNLPLRADGGREDLAGVLRSVTDNASGFGVVGLVGLVFAASGVMGAIRHALNRAWDVTDTRPIVQGKAVDVLLVLGVGALVALSFGLSLTERLVRGGGDDLGLGGPGASVVSAVLALGQFAPAAVAFLVALTLFRLVPPTQNELRRVWPGALVAAVGFELAKWGFAVYLESYASYGAVYASLATVIAFMVFTFVAANVFLLGAEVAVELPRVRAGAYDDEPQEPLSERVRGALRSLFVRTPARE